MLIVPNLPTATGMYTVCLSATHVHVHRRALQL